MNSYLNKMLTIEACVERYGPIDLASLHWPKANTWIKMLEIEKDAFPNWRVTNTQVPVTHIACNTDIMDPLKKALDLIRAKGLQTQLFTFDGCWSIRPVRGGNQLSAHSYGLAVDINAQSNRLGEQPTLSQDLVLCFEQFGWDWGGKFHRLDGMHFSRCWEGPRL